MIKVTVEYPLYDEDVDHPEHLGVRQREFACESWFLQEGCLVLRVGRADPGGWYFTEIGIPLTKVEAWFVGEGLASKALAQHERREVKI